MKIRVLQTQIYGANCYLIEDEAGGAVAIDPGAGADDINAFLLQENLHLTQVLLTHGHVDHVYHAAALGKKWGVPVAMHPEDLYLTDGTQTDDGLAVLPLENSFVPDVPLTDGMKLEIGPLAFTVYHTPGHSPGSCCLLLEDILFTGDTLFAGSIGRTDLTGGDPAVMEATLQHIKTFPDNWTILPGHGGGSTMALEKQNNIFLNGDAAKRGWM